MATITDVVDRARRVLQDYDADHHTDASLLVWANGARRALATAAPELYAVTSTLTAVSGARQTLPSDLNVFYDVHGATVVEREYLDHFVPGWRSGTPGAIVHYCYDEREKGFIDVYPPASNGASITISYSRNPTDLALNAAVSAQEAQRIDSLVDYTVARALMEDAQSTSNMQRGMAHLQLFAAATGADLGSLLSRTPNSFNTGGKPPNMRSG